MNHVQERLAKLVREVVEEVRKVVPRIACDQVELRDLDALLSAIQLLVSDWDMADLTLLLPLPRGRRHLFLQADLDNTCKLYLILVEVARHLLGDAEHAKLAAEVFAAAGTLVAPRHATRHAGKKRRQLVNGFGDEWKKHFVQKIEPVMHLVIRGEWTASGSYARGKLARARSDYEEAELHFRAGIRVGRATNEWDAVARCQIGLGNVARQRGNIPRAREHYQAALGTIESHALGGLLGPVHHELFRTAYEVGDFAVASAHGRLAMRAYPPRDPGLIGLGGDIATSCLVQGRYHSALRALQLMEPRVTDSRMKVTLTANICHAAGGAGERQLYEAAWDCGWVAIPCLESREGVAEAMLDMARGAASIGDRARAQLAASEALKLATNRREFRIVFAAESLLEMLIATGSGGDDTLPIAIRDESDGVLLSDLAEALSGCGSM